MRRYGLLLLLIVVLVPLSVALAISVGSATVNFTDVFQVMRYRFTGTGEPPAVSADRIVWMLRMPRAMLALLVGGGLSIIGVAMQTLVRNPLAEPYILGISSGATAGASLFYLGFLPAIISRTLSMPVAAFIGGLISITIVYLVARKGPNLSVTRLLLAGVAMSALMASITSFITLASPEPDRLRAVLFWLLGSLSGTNWAQLWAPGLATVFGLVLLLALRRSLDAMLIGEESAVNLGVQVENVKRLLIVLAALVTGTLVAYSGAIGFVGLIIPHAVRLITGVSHARLLPYSFVVGGLFLLWADVAARSVIPGQELPVGILTAVCGVPFFLILLRRGNYQFN